ncbi:hypothetical protein IW148_003553 [Coemansia sp. RSA 1199]|nr:hypothetical protein IW148_003553 [Coemansia sp. RSA 1199]
MEAPGTFVRKHSVQGAKWKPAYLSRLHEYVADVNYLTSHAYAFARFILLHEVDIEDSIIFQQFGTSFFYDVFLSCAERENEQEAGVEAQVRRAVILSYRNEYKRLSGLMLRKYEPLSQVASYVSKTMLTDYKNNVMLRFGETWRRAINLKLDSKNKMDKLVKRLKSEGRSVEEIREQRQAQIWSPARHAKQVLCSRWPVATTAEEQTIIDFVTPVLKCYPVGHEFKEDSIYLDSKTSPEKHIKAFIMLNQCLVAGGYSCIQALPLRRSWVYAHVPINTQILANHIFGEKYRPATDKQPATSPNELAVSPNEPAALPEEPAASPEEPATSPEEPAAPAGKPRKTKKPKPKRYTQEGYWEQVVDMKMKSFKDHPRHVFTGFIMTDGVSISVIRKNKEKLAAKVASKKRKREEQAQQEQPAAQRARLAAQPVQPSYQQPAVQLLYPQAQPSYPQPAMQLLCQQLAPSYLQLAPSFQQPAVQLLYLQALLLYQQPGVQPSFQPSFQPLYQPLVQLPVQQEQQPWIQVVQQAQEVWEARQRRLSAEQAWQECLMAEQALCVLQAQLSAEQARLSTEQTQLSVQLPAKKAKQRRPAQPRQKADCEYIDDLPQATLQSTAGRCILVDPGRRDLLFMMHEDSSIEEKKVYRYTRNQQRKETRLTKFKRILEKVKPADVAEAERSLGAGSCVKPDLELYKVYLVARERVADTLTRFYNKTYTVHPTSSHQIHKDKPRSEVQSFPLHRKLRLSAYVNRKQADQYLIKRLRDKFKPNAVIVIGDWSAPMTRYHEPIRGKSWRTLLKRGGFDVYLIKEYLTSKTCPNCNGRLSNTRDVPNPRPWRRHIQPEVKCHGLLSCQSEKCLESIGKSKGEKENESEGKKEGESKGNVKRWWNRDLAAVLNFRHILFSLRETGIAPARFQRGQPAEARKASTAPKTRKTRKAPKTRKTRKASTAPTAPEAPNPTNNLPAQL